ncbi:MAG: hypothetical protein PHC70_02765 [Patescibacteria group bacterium]|nr:hypothetical protein [Patescibacteria group bacterium]
MKKVKNLSNKNRPAHEVRWFDLCLGLSRGGLGGEIELTGSESERSPDDWKRLTSPVERPEISGQFGRPARNIQAIADLLEQESELLGIGAVFQVGPGSSDLDDAASVAADFEETVSQREAFMDGRKQVLKRAYGQGEIQLTLFGVGYQLG